MSHRGRKSRPLGSIRHSLTGLDSIPKLPPLATSQSIDKGYEGIHGNAMSVPPARRSPEKEDLHKSRTPLASSRNTSSSRSEGSKSDDSANAAVAEAKRELREALTREKQLKAHIAALQKTIETLKAELEEKAKANEELQQQLAKLAEQESRYKVLYEKESVQHRETQLRLTVSEDLVTERDREITQLKTTHQEQLKELNIKMEKRVLEVEKAKDAEIATRDEKLKRLKNQMADALRGNSWERQQQLDELSKELTRTHEEADMLRAKLKAIAKNGAKPSAPPSKKGVSGCANCESLGARSQHLERTISEKDKIIRELKGLGAKFEKQPSQKEIIQQLKNDRKTFK